MELLLKIHSKTDMLVLEPFCGGGSTALACEKLNRNWIGIEISEKYCEIAKKRISQEANQLKLFK
jgi:site-specific DNA-methyltransferase (adenine-specific)